MIWHLLLSKRFAVYLFLINFAVAKMGNAIYASRKGYKVKNGHRQYLTQIAIEEIVG